MPHPTARPFPRLALSRVVLALLAGVLTVSTLLTVPAYAHAGLVSTDPEDGTTLDAAPTSVTLTFNEELGEKAFVVVTAPDGKQQELDAPLVDGEVVTQTLDPETEAAEHPGGGWTIAYRVVSADGHVVDGHVRFRVTGEAPSPSQSTSEPDSETPAPRVDDDQDSSTNTAAIVVVSALAAVLAGVALVQARRRRA